MSHHDDWPEQDPPVSLRARLLVFGGCLFLLLVYIIGGWK